MPAADAKPFAEVSRLGLSAARLQAALARHDAHALPRLAMLWSYYRNPMETASPLAGAGGVIGRGLRLAQERGLPARVAGNWSARGVAALVADDRAWSRKEVVIENDVAWRIHTMVDFMFGRPIAISSTARDPKLRRTIERVLDAVWESSGGIGLLQDMGLLGHVYGHVDLLVRAITSREDVRAHTRTGAGASGNQPTRDSSTPTTTNSSGDGNPDTNTDATPRDAHAIDDIVLNAARNCVRVELVDPTRGVALPGTPNPQDLTTYILRSTREAPDADSTPAAQVAGAFADAIKRWWSGANGSADAQPAHRAITTIEVFSRGLRQTYEHAPDDTVRLIDESPALVEARDNDRPPIAHIQNISQPFAFAGLSEVEPLIPLQDELNTRLSDRASRVTLLSFKMFLAKGVDGAGNMPVAPGIIWSTDNPDAQIQTFGGDAASPSEDAHIEQIREAMDKASGVPPLASGVVRAKIGNLSSENALKITLMGLLSKTSRKRITYGRGIAEASRLILDALDRAGILKTTESDRAVRVDWTDPLPRDERQALEAAKAKVELGIPRERVLSELGYATTDPGVV